MSCAPRSRGFPGSWELVALTLHSVLEKAGVVKPREGGWKIDQFVNTAVAKVVE